MFHTRAMLAVALALGGCSHRTAPPVDNGTEDTGETRATSSLETEPFTGDGGPQPSDAGDAGKTVTPVVRLGVPDAEDPIDFAPLPEDGHVKIRMGGQGGTHAILGLQCAGFGNRILYEIRIEDLRGGGSVETPKLPAPRPIFCDNEGLCKLVPINVVIGGLAPPEQWPNLPVKMTLTVSNAQGLSASATAEGYLDPT